MGTQPISPGERDVPGATLSKADRYCTFLTEASAHDGGQTHYEKQYGDGLLPEVLFLVRTEGRASSVNAALGNWKSKSAGRECCAIRALTFDAAAAQLRSLAGLSPLARAVAVPPAQMKLPPALSGTDVRILQRCIYDSIKSIKRARAVFRQLQREDLPPYPMGYEQAWALLARLRSGLAQ